MKLTLQPHVKKKTRNRKQETKNKKQKTRNRKELDTELDMGGKDV